MSNVPPPAAVVPINFTWDEDGGYDDLGQFLNYIYSSEDAKRLLLQFQEFYKFLKDAEPTHDSIIIGRVYNQLVAANNYVLQFVDVEFGGLSMNEIKGPLEVAAEVREAFLKIETGSGDAEESKRSLVDSLRKSLEGSKGESPHSNERIEELLEATAG